MKQAAAESLRVQSGPFGAFSAFETPLIRQFLESPLIQTPNIIENDVQLSRNVYGKLKNRGHIEKKGDKRKKKWSTRAISYFSG